MRTTLVIDDDVLDKARAVAARRRRPFRQIVNDALRAGLETVDAPAKSRPYRMQPHKMGLKAGLSLDNIGELLAQIEGESYR